MRLSYFILSLLFLFPAISFGSDVEADNSSFEGSVLPSESTWQEIEGMNRKPSLRYGPGGDDGGGANKETPFPIGDADAYVLLSLSALSLIYVIHTKRRKHEN